MGKALSGELSCPCDRSCFSYFFAIKCQNNYSYQEKLGLLESAPFKLTASGGLGGPQPPGLINMSRLIGFILFISLPSTTFIRKGEHVMLFLPQMNVWIYPKIPNFGHKFPIFFLLLYL